MSDTIGESDAERRLQDALGEVARLQRRWNAVLAALPDVPDGGRYLADVVEHIDGLRSDAAKWREQEKLRETIKRRAEECATTQTVGPWECGRRDDHWLCRWSGGTVAAIVDYDGNWRTFGVEFCLVPKGCGQAVGPDEAKQSAMEWLRLYRGARESKP